MKHGAVDAESGSMLHGALKYKDMTVGEIMTPASGVFMIPLSGTLNYALMTKIFRSGYSRIPVYDNGKNDVVGIMLSKDLMLIDPKDCTPVRNFMTLFGRKPIVVWSDHKLGEMLNLFRQGSGHIALVRDVNNSGSSDPYYECKGIVTLEDIVEEIIGQEINDELDDDDENAGGEQEIRNRDRDLALLDLLNGKTEEEKLSMEEVQAVSSHLMNNVPQFSDTCRIVSKGKVMDIADLQIVLSQAHVIVANRQSTESMLAHRNPAPADILFDHSLSTERCILIMTGRVVVYAGHDQFRSELGPWSIIGLDALRSNAPTFEPDFSAYILSENIRFLVLTKNSFVVDPNSTLPKRPLTEKATSLFGKRETSRSITPVRHVSAERNLVVESEKALVFSPLWSTNPENTSSAKLAVSSSSTNASNDSVSIEMGQRALGGHRKYERIDATIQDDDYDNIGEEDLLSIPMNDNNV